MRFFHLRLLEKKRTRNCIGELRMCVTYAPSYFIANHIEPHVSFDQSW